MPSCILTGATGYIGSHVARHLLDEGWEVAIISQPQFGYDNINDIKSKLKVFEYDGNIRNLIDFFKARSADVVLHLAAAVITNYTPQQIPVLIRSNVEFGTEILEAMKHSATRLFIGTGSYWQNYNSDSYNPVDLYAATKEAFEKILQYYVDAFDIRAITLRLFDVYGEDDKRPKLWNILRDISGTNQTIDLSPGGQLLDLVHISDVAKAYERAYYLVKENKDLKNEIFGVFSNNRKSLKEIVNLFEKISGKTLNLNWGGKDYKKREVLNPTEKYNLIPDWFPEIDLEEGFRRFFTNDKS